MIALCVILAIMLIILVLPLGVDASYIDSVLKLKIKAGPIRYQLLPKEEGKKPKKPKKKKEKKPKPQAAEGKEKKKLQLTLDDIFTLLEIVFRTLGRFRRSLSVDRFMFHFVSGNPDPYSAVMLYGYLNAGLNALAPAFHRALKVRDEDVQTAVDLDLASPVFEGQLVLTIQLWQIMFVSFSALFAALRWFIPYKKRIKQAELTDKKG